jgi:hypothetical protein
MKRIRIFLKNVPALKSKNNNSFTSSDSNLEIAEIIMDAGAIAQEFEMFTSAPCSTKKRTAAAFPSRQASARGVSSVLIGCEKRIELRVESGERRVESGEWRAESGEWRAESGERRAESGERRAESGERRVESGEWRVESGERRAESGERRAESGERRAESGERRGRSTGF